MKYIICVVIIIASDFSLNLVDAHAEFQIPKEITIGESFYANCTGHLHTNDAVADGYEFRKNDELFYKYADKNAHKFNVSGINENLIDIYNDHPGLAKIINATKDTPGEYVCYFLWHNTTGTYNSTSDPINVKLASHDNNNAIIASHNVFSLAFILILIVKLLL